MLISASAGLVPPAFSPSDPVESAIPPDQPALADLQHSPLAQIASLPGADFAIRRDSPAGDPPGPAGSAYSGHSRGVVAAGHVR